MAKETKVLTRRRKFIPVEIPLINTKLDVIGTQISEIEGKRIKLDLTRQLKGKSVEATVKIENKDEKAIAKPIKIRLLPYFIRRMIRKRISYIESSFETPSQESMIQVKPFLITRKRVSRAVKNALRNRSKNWLEDYIAERTDEEIFEDILSNRLQKPLSLVLKKTYPLSLCEIRILEIKRPLKPEEVPKIKPKEKKETVQEELEEIDQLKEIEEERKKAEKEIKETQEKAIEIEKKETKNVKKTTKKTVKKSTKKVAKKKKE